VFDTEGRRELGVVEGEADFFPGFAAGDLVWNVLVILLIWGNVKYWLTCGFVGGVGFAAGEGGMTFGLGVSKGRLG